MDESQAKFGIIVLVLFALFVAWRNHRRWRPTGWAHGTASWATEADLLKAGMFGRKGLILGRTRRRGRLIRLPKYTHLSVFAPTGAGKGVSYVIPTLLDYRGPMFVFDPKGENYRLTANRRRAMGQQVIRMDPFKVCGPGGDSFNPLLEVSLDDPRLIDEARSLADAMVFRPPDEREPFWSNSAVGLLTAMIVVTLLTMKEEHRNLSTVRELLTDPDLFKEAIKRLQALGDIPARLGNSLAKQSESEKEIAGVISTANTHTAFLDSNLIGPAVNSSTFSADVLLKGGTTIYFILPVEQLDAQRNFLRLVVSSLLRHVMRHGAKGAALFLLDEASSLGSLDALSQALQLGRGKGLRLMLFWQTAEQAQAAFKNLPNLVSDNCDAKVYFGVNSPQTAELVSKALGNWTMVTSTFNESASGSRSSTSGTQPSSHQRSWSTSTNVSEHGRALMDASEILRLHGDLFIAFIRNVRPILGRRLKYYSDPLFRAKKSRLFWCAVVAFALIARWLIGS